MHNIAVLPGDGIGPEVLSVALDVMNKLAEKYNIEFKFDHFPFGGEHYLKTGEVLSDESMKTLKKYDAIFLGAVGSPDVKAGILEKGILLKLRFDFDQYINLRPVKLYPGIETPVKNKNSEDIDYIVVRENTGGLYSGIGGSTMTGTPYESVSQSMTYTYKQIDRCLRYAFETAAKRERKTLALVGKTNVLTHVFALWENLFNEIGRNDYPEVKREYYHVDATCMYMVNSPERFDVLVTTNMFGDIITDLGAETQGGIGMASSANINPEKTAPSMFEPVHGSAPDIAGENKANPLATLMSAKMMLEFLNENTAAEDLDKAIMKTAESGFEGLGTKEIGQKILNMI